MASKPEKVSNGWRTRWRYGSRWNSITEEYEADCWSACNYVTGLNNKIYDDDPLITGKAYLHGDAVAIATVKAGQTFGQVARMLLEIKDWSDNRDRAFRGVLKNHYGDWANWPVDRIDVNHLNAKYKEKKAAGWVAKSGQRKPYTHNTLVGIMEVAVSVLNFAFDHGMLSGANPTKSKYIAFERTGKVPARREHFTPQEFDALLDLAHPDDERFKTTLRDYAMVVTLCVFGLRIGELCSLNVGDVKLADLELHVQSRHLRKRGRVAGTKETAEDDKPLVLAFDENYGDLIADYIGDRSASAPLFPGVRLGRHLNPDEWREAVWTPLLRTAVELGLIRDNIEIVPHVMRHTMITWMLDHLPFHLVQKRANQKDPKTTRRYQHRSLDPERAAMGKVFTRKF